MRVLAVLVADKDMDFALRGLLARHKALGIRTVDYETRRHSGHDPGVRTTGPETIALLRDQFRHGILMLDWEGSGSEIDGPLALEQEVDSRLAEMWDNRAKAIVIEPELEAWVWGSDNAMRLALGWKEDLHVRHWLAGQGYEFHATQKPVRPKEALHELMVRLSEPRSSALYERLTGKISMAHCVDPAFNRLKATLQLWFTA